METKSANLSRVKCVEGYFDINGHINFVCNLCGEIVELPDLIIHIQDHFSETPYKCYKCRHTFCELDIFMNHTCHITPVKIDSVNIISVSTILTNKVKSTTKENIINCLKEEPIEISPTAKSDSIFSPKLSQMLDSSALIKTALSPYKSSTKSPPSTEEPLVKIQTKRKSEDAILASQLLSTTSQIQDSTTFQSSPAIEGPPPIKIPTKRKRKKAVRTNVQCEYCGILIRSYNLQGHYVHHKIKTLKQVEYKCDICGRIFGLLSYLRRHMPVHLNEKPFACSVCGKRFRDKGRISKHEKIHREATLICTICSKQFVLRKQLRKHQLVHTGEKPYKCDFCEIFFRTPSARRVHRRLHTGEKPYKCNCCGKTFTQIGSLKFHIKTSIKNGTICGKESSNLQ